jgi:hypothetical protein
MGRISTGMDACHAFCQFRRRHFLLAGLICRVDHNTKWSTSVGAISETRYIECAILKQFDLNMYLHVTCLRQDVAGSCQRAHVRRASVCGPFFVIKHMCRSSMMSQVTLWRQPLHTPRLCGRTCQETRTAPQRCAMAPLFRSFTTRAICYYTPMSVRIYLVQYGLTNCS